MLAYAGQGFPFVMPPEDCDGLADWMEAAYPDEFCLSLSFDPDFLDCLCGSGFIPMATEAEGGRELLVPKMHVVRSVLRPREARVTRTARRESARYSFALDTRFDEVLEACARTHGEDWLRPPLRECWRELHATSRARASRFASMELYSGGRLVAGEIGVFAGACYTSLTGFRAEPGSGTVQLAAAAGYLERAGVLLWDLGMPLPYKRSLGAREVTRAEFLRLFREARAVRPGEVALPLAARELIDALPRGA
jgi:Leu/Phe-tRNA-protein transferase